ncbi:hypothetical protein [Streptomyces sp. NPDC002785]|uniref:hypothetical protein n=1 Tax=Streptomyces sp. NPDC002785 TaxID=3154543 RepID=UPI00332D4462
MSDVYVVDFALDIRASAPGAVLADLRWHLGIEDGEDAPTGTYPLLAARGPAARIGGVQVGELAGTADGWSLTARQEVHAELIPELDSLVERLAWNSGTEGVIGQIRFYEEDVPDLLLSRAGELVKMSLVPAAEEPGHNVS